MIQLLVMDITALRMRRNSSPARVPLTSRLDRGSLPRHRLYCAKEDYETLVCMGEGRVAIGVILGVLLIGGGLWFEVRRRQTRKATETVTALKLVEKKMKDEREALAENKRL
jgi:hypothetical protein